MRPCAQFEIEYVLCLNYLTSKELVLKSPKILAHKTRRYDGGQNISKADSE
jgi:hypothetical protein